MPITSGNFDDLVQLSQDTLYMVGPAITLGNTSVGSSASLGFQNTEGAIQIVAVPATTGSANVYLPTYSMSIQQGMSSFYNGNPVTTFGITNSVSLQPVVVPYAISVTNLLWLISASFASGDTLNQQVSAAVYTVTGSSISLASSASFSSTSGSLAGTNTGIGWQSMTVGTWNFTPGLYIIAWLHTAGIAANGMSYSLFGTATNPTIATVDLFHNPNQSMLLPGYFSSGGLPSSIALSNTASWIRSGASVLAQMAFTMQGT